MKLLKLAFLLGIATLFLSSCRKDSLQSSSQTTTDVNGGPESPARANGLINGTKIYTLVKHGDNELSYYGDGRLSQVKSPTETSIYTYGGFGEIYVTRKSGNTLTGRDTFLLNPDGKCFYSKSSRYIYLQNGTLTSNKEWKYSYDANGQLKKVYDPYNASLANYYSYDADGNLSSVNTIGSNGLQKSNTTFFSSTPSNPGKVIDRFPLNPDNAEIEDGYLRIFGKFNKYLIKKATHVKLNTGFNLGNIFLYSHVLNADNVVTEVKTYNGYTNQLISVAPYSWSVSY